MAHNNLIKPRKRDILLFSTPVENLFINELLPVAPGNYIKVFLFCLMNAEYDCELDVELTSRVLGMSEDEVDSAWAYWEDKGAVKRVYDKTTGEYKIIFISQIETFYGGGPYTDEPTETGNEIESGAEEEGSDYEFEEETVTAAQELPAKKPVNEAHSNPYGEDFLDDDTAKIMELEMRGLFTAFEEASGRPISRKESDKIRDAINLYSVMPDVFAYAIKYCAELEKYSVDYIFTVAIRWTEEGCKDISQVKELLDRDSQRNAAYSRIFKEMGFSRLPSPGDREIMGRWFDEMNFKLPEILDACRRSAGLREPSLKYVNKVLENRIKEAGGVKTGTKVHDSNGSGATNVSKRVLGEYYEHLRNNAELEFQEHLEEAKRIPYMKDILAMEMEFNKSLVSLNFSPKAKEDRKARIARFKELEEQKKQVLLDNGYPADFLEKKFKCELCKDTGVSEDGKYCSCARERAKEAYTWNQRREKQNPKYR